MTRVLEDGRTGVLENGRTGGLEDGRTGGQEAGRAQSRAHTNSSRTAQWHSHSRTVYCAVIQQLYSTVAESQSYSPEHSRIAVVQVEVVLVEVE